MEGDLNGNQIRYLSKNLLWIGIVILLVGFKLILSYFIPGLRVPGELLLSGVLLLIYTAKTWRLRRRLMGGVGLLGLILLLLSGCGLAEAEPTPVPPTQSPTPVPPQRALLVIQEHFNAEEYNEPRTLLEEAGVIVTVASTSIDTTTAYAQEAEAQPDMLLSEVRPADYDVIVFVGGYPYDTELPEMHRIAQEAVAEGRLVAGICNGVLTMGEAGVLEGKHVTSLLYHPVSLLEEAGATIAFADVERDGLIITGSGPSASHEFAEVIVQALAE